MDFTPSGIPYYVNHSGQLTTSSIPHPDVVTVPNDTEDSSQHEKKKSGAFQRSSSKRRSGKKVVEKMPAVKRNPVTIVTRRGWLYKQETTPLKPWKKRWFVLAEFCLFHYKGSEEGQCLGSILLPGYHISTCDKDEDGISRKFAFKAEHENVKTLYFTAETQEDMEAWINVMSLAAAAELPSGIQENTNPVLENKENSAFPRSKSQSDLKKPSYSVHMSLQADDPPGDQVIAFAMPDKVGQGFQNSHAKQWQRHSLDDVDAPSLKHNTVEDGQQPGERTHSSRNNLNETADVTHEPQSSLSNMAGRKSLDLFPGLQGTKEEIRRSRDNFVDVSVLSGGRPLLSKSDSKNQDIINWLGITSSVSAIAGSDNKHEESSHRELTRPVDPNPLPDKSRKVEIQSRSVNQNKQGISPDIGMRNSQSMLTGQSMNLDYDSRNGMKYGLSNSPYKHDSGYRGLDQDRIQSSSSSTSGKDDRGGQYIRLQEPNFYVARHEQDNEDLQDKIKKGRSPNIINKVTGLYDSNANAQFQWDNMQAHESDWTKRKLTTESPNKSFGYNSEFVMESSRAPTKPAHTNQPMTNFAREAPDAVKNFDEHKRESRYTEMDNTILQQASDTSRLSYVPTGLGSKLDAMTSQIKAWSEGHSTGPNTTNQNKLSIESEYAVVNKRRSPNVLQGTQPSVDMHTKIPLQGTQSSVATNLQNNNAQQHMNLDKQKIFDGYSRQYPDNKFDEYVDPEESNGSNNASIAARHSHSALPSSREEEQFNVRPVQTPRVAVDSAWDAGPDSQSDKRKTVQDPNQLQECKVLLDEHRRLRSAVDAFNWSTTDNDQVVKQLISIRRSQARLEETRYWLLSYMYQLPETFGVDNDISERSELKRYILELETEISLTNPIVLQLESRLTRRSDTVKANSQNRNDEGGRFENVPSALTSSNSNSVPELTSGQWNNQPASKPSTYVTSGKVDSSVPRASLQKQERTIVPSSKDDSELEAKRSRIQELQRAVEDQSFKLGQLREEKVFLMKALYQAQKDEDDERDAQRRMRLRQQRQVLDKELFAAQRHLTEETKRFEELTSASGSLASDVQAGRSLNFENRTSPQQFRLNGSAGGSGSMQHLDITSQANQNMSRAARSTEAAAMSSGKTLTNHPSHDVAQSNPSQSRSTYFETDLDSGCCRDLAAISRRLADNTQPAESSQPERESSQLIASSSVTLKPAALDNPISSWSNAKAIHTPFEQNRDSNINAGQAVHLRHPGHTSTRQFGNKSSRIDHNDNLLTAGGNVGGLANRQSGLVDSSADAQKLASYRNTAKLVDRNEFSAMNYDHEATNYRIGDVNRTSGLRMTDASISQRTIVNENTHPADILKTRPSNWSMAGGAYLTKPVVDVTSTAQWDRFNGRPVLNSERPLDQNYNQKLTMNPMPAAGAQYSIDVSDRSREQGRRGVDHTPSAAYRSKSVPRDTPSRAAHNTASTRAVLSDEEEDYTIHPIGVNTADRVRRLSGLYTPRPFVGNAGTAGVAVGQPGTMHDAAHMSHAGSSSALRYDPALNSADVDLDDLVNRQVQRVSTDRAANYKHDSAKTHNPYSAATSVEQANERRHRWQQLHSSDKLSKMAEPRSLLDDDRAARHDAVRSQQPRQQQQHLFSTDQSSQWSRQPVGQVHVQPPQPSVRENIRKMLESADDGSCL